MFVIASWMMGCFVLLPVPVLCGMATSTGFVVDRVGRIAEPENVLQDLPGKQQSEWLRSHPDRVVYIPRGGTWNDGDNEHFLVFPSHDNQELLAIWTQSTREGFGDNHLVIARSRQGVKWSDPEWIIGTHKNTDEFQASWGFPVVSRSGKIYCFYTRAKQGVPGGVSGIMGGVVSDNKGRTWTKGPDRVVPSTREDPFDLDSPESGSFIVWQKPIRDSHGHLLVGYTRSDNQTGEGSLHFMRFDNIDEGPTLSNVEITWLPEAPTGVRLPRYVQPAGCEEPSLVLLPDGRLMATMRTRTGYVWYTLSADDGNSWCDPEVLRYSDTGEKIKQPLASCPIYPLRDGRFLLLFHNNDHVARHEHAGDPLPSRHPDIPLSPIFCYRRPAFIAIGEYRRQAHQPVWFSQPMQLLDTQGIPIGPKRTDEIATYTSMTWYGGEQVLWYPDRKYFLLGKVISESILSEMSVPEN